MESNLKILHTNDFHGALTSARCDRLYELRSDCDLYFDCGDAIRSGNLGVPLGQEEVWSRLANLRCDASVPGNRESHIVEALFRRKIAGAGHPILCANMRDREGRLVLPESLVLDRGLRVGVFGVMVPMVTRRMRTQAASAFLWDPPLEAATRAARDLRSEVDLLIALTHIGINFDRKLAEECPDIDLILGGHSHTVLAQPEHVGRTAICQTGSHARFAGVYEWRKGEGLVGARLEPLSN